MSCQRVVEFWRNGVLHPVRAALAWAVLRSVAVTARTFFVSHRLLVSCLALGLVSIPAAQALPRAGTVAGWGLFAISAAERETRFTAIAAGSGFNVALRSD